MCVSYFPSLYFQAIRLDKLEADVSKYKEKLRELTYHKEIVEVRRDL